MNLLWLVGGWLSWTYFFFEIILPDNNWWFIMVSLLVLGLLLVTSWATVLAEFSSRKKYK